MKRKIITLITAIVCAMACAFGLVACNNDESNSLDFLSLSVENVQIIKEDKAAKTSEYNVTIVYGDNAVINYDKSVALKDIELWASYTNSGGKYVSLKTDDNPDGYEIDGVLPDNPNVGTYTVKYLYDGWTITVNFVVEKRAVYCPYLLNLYYYWTGEEIKPELLNDSEYITYNRDYGQTEIGDYALDVDLKDSENCKWVDREGEEATATRVIEWHISKATYIVDNDLFLSGGTENDYFVKCYEYVYDGTAKEFHINEEAIKDFKDNITITIINGKGETVTEMREVGIYNLVLTVKDPEHTRIKNKKESPDGWDRIFVGELRITEPAA